MGGIACAVLFAVPVHAEELDTLEPSEPFKVAVAPVITEPALPVLTSVAAGTMDICAPVSLANAATIAPAAAPSHSKAAAILGGAPSSLERMRLAQSGIAPNDIAPIVPAAEAATANAVTPHTALAVAETSFASCNRISPMIAQSPHVADNRMILGSLRLSIRRTPFDQQWSKVSSNRTNRGLKYYLPRTGATTAATPLKQVEAINGWVNSKISYTDDSKLYRQNDYWASSRETLRRRKGDCEDYAILKMDLLAAMGFDRNRMILVVARDLVRNADHAVLVVQLDDGPVILDNATDRLLDGRLPHDYRPIMSFANSGKWLHGYAMAAAYPQPAPAVPAIVAASVPSTPVIALSTPVSAGN